MRVFDWTLARAAARWKVCQFTAIINTHEAKSPENNSPNATQLKIKFSYGHTGGKNVAKWIKYLLCTCPGLKQIRWRYLQTVRLHLTRPPDHDSWLHGTNHWALLTYIAETDLHLYIQLFVPLGKLSNKKKRNPFQSKHNRVTHSLEPHCPPFSYIYRVWNPK